MGQTKNRQRLKCLRMMPPLSHAVQGEPFDIMKSELVAWMVMQPEVRQWLYDEFVDTARGKHSGFFRYDKKTGKWQGYDYGRD